MTLITYLREYPIGECIYFHGGEEPHSGGWEDFLSMDGDIPYVSCIKSRPKRGPN